jgi:hypothetical protein
VTKHRKKILILLPDGVSLRNFAYTSFYQLGVEKGFDVIFWNTTPFKLTELGFSEIKIQKPSPHWHSVILKNAQKRIEIRLFAERDNDSIYFEYLFPLSYKDLKSIFKSSLTKFYAKWYGSENGLNKIRIRIITTERGGEYYLECKNILEKECPDFVFCTSQRSVNAIAPLTAAQDLKIPTSIFIFSWDNIPKATMVTTADHYFVWSELMKSQLLHYQRYIVPSKVYVSGTPQFEPHYEPNRILTRDEFCKQHGLDSGIKHICYSGDDITTSPKDELYLRDVSQAVRELHKKGQYVKIIFRRCPVDFSNRYNEVLKEYKDVLVDISPLWRKIGDGWNAILPTPEDLDLQANIIAHTEFVINLASSMVFDYVAHGKPCAYLNYNYLNSEEVPEKGVKLYTYVHFRSMPSAKAVVWMNSPSEIGSKIEHMLKGIPKTVLEASEWFKVINLHPPQNASARIWDTIEKLTAPRIAHSKYKFLNVFRL